MSAPMKRQASSVSALLAGNTRVQMVATAPPERRIEIRDDEGNDGSRKTPTGGAMDAVLEEEEETGASDAPFSKVETPSTSTRGSGFRMMSGLRAPRQQPPPSGTRGRRSVMFGGISTVSLPNHVDEEREEDVDRDSASRASSSFAMSTSQSRSMGMREGDLRSSMESSLSSTTALMSETTQQRWFARIDPQRDLKWYSNRFRDDRLEESYQLDTSMGDLPTARRRFLFLVIFQVLAYLLFLELQSVCIGSSPLARMEGANSTDCVTYVLPDDFNSEIYVVLWAYVPFALLYSLFPLKFLERTMRLRIVIYYFRRTWKSIAVVILLLWSVGLDVFMHTLLFAVRSQRQTTINVTGETSCAKKIPMDREWYVDSLFLQLHQTRDYMSLQYWILVYQAKITSTIIMAVLALVATVTGIVSFALKLDFPHVVFSSGALWVTMFMMRIFGPNFSLNSRSEHTKGLTIFLMLSALLPTVLTLIATYSEDRACRIAYASKVRAERMNTSLKLDLSVKRMGLENRNLPRDEKEMMEEELINASDTRILKKVSIPFGELELKDVVAKTPNGDILLADYHGTQVVLKRLALSSCTPEGLKDFKVKVQMQAMLRHPNIVLFIGATYDNLANVGIVMEYLERGDVFSLLRSSIALSWSDPLLKIATDVALGVSYLHNCDPPLVHRDLKSSNLLCTTTYSCKISDFGESKRQVAGGGLFSTIVGTPYWLAPEILREEKYDTQVDCYSFGIVLIELETRKDPYYDRTEESTIDIMVHVAQGTLRPTIPGSCSPCRRDLITRCLDSDPKRRPKMTEILRTLQNEVRQEVFDQNAFDHNRDRRRLMLMQRHQRLNRRGVKDLMLDTDDDEE